MLFFASDLFSRVGVWPVLDPGVLAGSDGEGTSVGTAVAALPCARGGCNTGIAPPDLWHPTSVTAAIVSPTAIRALVPMTSRRQDRDVWSGEAWL